MSLPRPVRETGAEGGIGGQANDRSRREFVKAGVATGLGAVALGGISGAVAQSSGDLSNPNATREAVAVYNYVRDISGRRILSGQEYEPWGVDEMSYIQDVIGRQPAIMGLDFIHPDQNDWRIQNATSHWQNGGIPTIMWHWGAPSVGQGYEESQAEIDVWRCFEEGTPEHQDMWSDLEATADLLEQLQAAGVPVIWRPLHELNGGWFWWSKSGPEAFIQLWRTMYDYFVTERGLNNLIWVLCYTGNPDGAWDPGPGYYDIAGGDTYGAGRSSSVGIYDDVVSIHGDDIPVAFHECGTPPDPDACATDGAWWAWWMNWHTGHLTDTADSYLQRIYDHETVVTLDEVPNVVAEYCPSGGECTSTGGDGTTTSTPGPIRVPESALPSSRTVADGTYQLISVHSGHAVEVTDGSSQDGATVQVGADADASHQQWELGHDGAGHYELRNVASGKAMDVMEAAMDNGTDVVQWTANEAGNQRWYVDPLGDDRYRLVAAHSRLVLDAAGTSTAAGTNVQQWEWVEHDNQRWQIVAVDGQQNGTQPVVDAQDLDGDGTSEDVNANGRLDNDDIVTYFEHMDSAAIQENVAAFDYNGNGRIDFDDVVTLFEEQ